jgi:hypothetical protein
MKGEDLHHHALEQLPHLAYCINDNPRWGKQESCTFQYLLLLLMLLLWSLFLLFKDCCCCFGFVVVCFHLLLRVLSVPMIFQRKQLSWDSSTILRCWGPPCSFQRLYFAT